MDICQLRFNSCTTSTYYKHIGMDKSANIVSWKRFLLLFGEIRPQTIPRNCIFVTMEFAPKLTILPLEFCGTKLPPNRLVLCQFCGQCSDLRFQLAYHFHRCIQSLLYLGFLAFLDIELLCRSCRFSYSDRSSMTFEEKGTAWGSICSTS